MSGKRIKRPSGCCEKAKVTVKKTAKTAQLRTNDILASSLEADRLTYQNLFYRFVQSRVRVYITIDAPGAGVAFGSDASPPPFVTIASRNRSQLQAQPP